MLNTKGGVKTFFCVIINPRRCNVRKRRGCRRYSNKPIKADPFTPQMKEEMNKQQIKKGNLRPSKRRLTEEATQALRRKAGIILSKRDKADQRNRRSAELRKVIDHA